MLQGNLEAAPRPEDQPWPLSEDGRPRDATGGNFAWRETLVALATAAKLWVTMLLLNLVPNQDHSVHFLNL